VVSAAGVQRLHEPVDGYARGWLVQDGAGGRRSSHEGSAGTFYAVAIIDHGRQVGAAVLANSGSAGAARGARQAAEELLRQAGDHPPPSGSKPAARSAAR
jgi:hypothetical protein